MSDSRSDRPRQNGVLNWRPLGVAQAAQWLGVPERTIRHWARTGRIRGYRDPESPKLWRFDRQELERAPRRGGL